MVVSDVCHEWGAHRSDIRALGKDLRQDLHTGAARAPTAEGRERAALERCGSTNPGPYAAAGLTPTEP